MFRLLITFSCVLQAASAAEETYNDNTVLLQATPSMVLSEAADMRSMEVFLHGMKNLLGGSGATLTSSDATAGSRAFARALLGGLKGPRVESLFGNISSVIAQNVFEGVSDATEGAEVPGLGPPEVTRITMLQAANMASNGYFSWDPARVFSDVWYGTNRDGTTILTFVLMAILFFILVGLVADLTSWAIDFMVKRIVMPFRGKADSTATTKTASLIADSNATTKNASLIQFVASAKDVDSSVTKAIQSMMPQGVFEALAALGKAMPAMSQDGAVSALAAFVEGQVPVLREALAPLQRGTGLKLQHADQAIELLKRLANDQVPLLMRSLNQTGIPSSAGLPFSHDIAGLFSTLLAAKPQVV